MKKLFVLCFLLVSLPIMAWEIDDYVHKIDGLNYVLNKDNMTATVWEFNNVSGDVVIPEEVIFEENKYIVTQIDSRAFWNSDKMTSIVIPESVETIGNMAFNGCSSLKTINIPQKVTKIGDGTFTGCKSLTSIMLPEKLTSIESYAFSDCSSLTSVTIPNNVASIGVCAFWHCGDMTDVFCYTDIIPSGFSSSFGDDDISSITLHVHDYVIESFKALNMNLKNIVVFDKVTDFNLTYYVDGEEYKKEQHKYDDEITPEPAPTKKGHTFSGWSKIPERMPGKDIDVTGTFTWSKDIIDNVIYEVCDTLNYYANVIGNKQASGEVKILSSISFDYNYKVTAIVGKAFYGCKGITKIEMADDILSIGERAFANIDKMTDVTIYAENVPETDRTAFENSYVGYATLHVPYGMVDKYKAVGPWKDFKEIVAIEGTEPPFTEKCKEPTIEYKDGKLIVNSETEGAECITSITSEDFNTHNGNEIEITATYNISSYAKAEGYGNSDVVSATLSWIEVEETGTHINEQIKAKAVLVRSNEGTLWITGPEEGTMIEVYNVAGQKIVSVYATIGTTMIETDLNVDDVALVKIKNKTVKVVMR